jgi:hypothetical protein
MSEAIGLIHGAGGVAVIGHPAHSGLVHLIPLLVQAGLDGVEVYYPFTPEEQAELLEMPRAITWSSRAAATFTSPSIPARDAGKRRGASRRGRQAQVRLALDERGDVV